ncbi:nucleotidyltransferase family protein [Chitinimonas viridis]|uniref:Nucleotidyltransferase family protein n=1 Tax=Chitinimonas viridis TaxID=664880 RepID=A0ABT8B4D5_9NEIS|nr:nucleotidyltransferase family protein [Chitinimonas viridis]MDN3576870.1 nucleotidyltransferase family protein [Chitinimonas viridis]
MQPDLAARLLALVAASPWLMAALRAARTLGLPDWCLAAGVVRNMVWDAAHGRTPQPWPESDVDLVYFDATVTDTAHDAGLQARLTGLVPSLVWEVSNQAQVHCWFERYFGHPTAPITSLAEGIASWPETATAVGVWLDHADQLQLVAPLGLEDLFGLLVRRNPAHVSIATYRQRIADKRYAERWPLLTILHE